MYYHDMIQSLNGNANYKLVDGIFRNNAVYSDSQMQTKDTFGFKWSQGDSFKSSTFQDNERDWYSEKYFDGMPCKANEMLAPGGNFLEAGCGAGISALVLFGKALNDVNYLGVDISNAVDVAKKRFADEGVKGEFLQTSLTDLPFDGPLFDVILSEGVLHHTDSTEESFRYLARFLRPNGRIMFYVYRKKSAIREFTDDYIREAIKDKSNEGAWKALEPLTKLGKALGELNCKINIPEDIDILGIKAGEMDIQRFFYYHVCKAYYRKDFSIDEMNHINFDWFRPLNCHRHTEEEVRQWCESEGLEVERMHVEPSGITTIARKV